jgi:hypothetical protein
MQSFLVKSSPNPNFAKKAFSRDMRENMTAYNREHLQAYRVPEIDPDVSEEYKQMLTTEGLGYDYTPEF